MRSKTCSRWRPAAGLTLLEIVAALAILGTVLAGVVLARTRHLQQLAHARQCEAAVRATDALLANWWFAAQDIPVNQQGTFGREGSLQWTTVEVDNPALATWGARVIRVTVRPAPGEKPTQADAEILVTVDLVVPDRNWRQEDRE